MIIRDELFLVNFSKQSNEEVSRRLRLLLQYQHHFQEEVSKLQCVHWHMPYAMVLIRNYSLLQYLRRERLSNQQYLNDHFQQHKKLVYMH